MEINWQKWKDKRTALEKAIDEVLAVMEGEDPSSDFYDKCARQLERLYKLKTVDKTDRKLLDPNQLLAAGVSIGSILIILKYEEFRVVTSKAFGLIHKPRL